MRGFRIHRGLDLPLPRPTGCPPAELRAVSHIGIVGRDYPFKPHFTVALHDRVERGQKLFTNKDDPRICVTAPAAGRVVAIHRAERRVFESIVLEVDADSPGAARPYTGEIRFEEHARIREYLQQGGAWAYLRTRPFSRIPHPEADPAAIFVNAMDSRPGAVPVRTLLAGRESDLLTGLDTLAALTTSPVYFCQAPSEDWGFISERDYPHGGRRLVASFTGPHPAGLSATHIHLLRPASLKHSVWTVTAKHAADIGALVATGILPNRTRLLLTDITRKRSQLIETLQGASTGEILASLAPAQAEPWRAIAGNILYGWQAEGAIAYAGIFQNQITLLAKEEKRHFLQWLRPGMRSYSITRTVLGRYRSSSVDWSTALYGSARALVPIGSYERVMPLDILITPLLRALLTHDTEQAAELGALELEPEDLSLATYVCPGKKDYGALLGEVLAQIEKEIR